MRRNATPTDFYGQAIFAMHVPGDHAAYVQQWNAAVEQQIGKDASLTVAYAGSRGTHLLLQGWATVSNVNLNQLPDQYFSMGPAALLAQVPNPFSASCTWDAAPPPLRLRGPSRDQRFRLDSFCCPFRNTSEFYSWILTKAPPTTGHCKHRS